MGEGTYPAEARKTIGPQLSASFEAHTLDFSFNLPADVDVRTCVPMFNAVKCIENFVST